MLLIFLMYALFGTVFTVGKIALVTAPPFFLTGVRMLLAGLLMMAYKLYKDPSCLKFSKNFIYLLLMVALFNVFITNGFEFWGLQYMTSGKTSLLYSLSPFAAALIAAFFKTEPMSKLKWLGVLMGICSFAPLLMPAESEMMLESFAEIALAISAVTAVIGWIFFKKLTIDLGYDGGVVNGLSFLLAGIMSLSLSFMIEDIPSSEVLFSWEFTVPLLYIVIIHNLICYSIFASSLKKYSVTFLSFAGLSNPLFAAVTGALFLGETLHAAFILAFLGGLAGLYLINKADARMQPQRPPEEDISVVKNLSS